MAKAYSVDLRSRVLGDHDKGTRSVELADRYQVSERWIYKLLRQRRETGSIEPIEGKAGRKRKLAGYEKRLRALVKRRPDATLEELRRELRLPICVWTVWKALQDLKLTLKKSHSRRRTKAA